MMHIVPYISETCTQLGLCWFCNTFNLDIRESEQIYLTFFGLFVFQINIRQQKTYQCALFETRAPIHRATSVVQEKLIVADIFGQQVHVMRVVISSPARKQRVCFELTILYGEKEVGENRPDKVLFMALEQSHTVHQRGKQLLSSLPIKTEDCELRGLPAFMHSENTQQNNKTR